MRFTIRHLLWFTLLAAVGCWWWLPSASDAASAEGFHEGFQRLQGRELTLVRSDARISSRGSGILVLCFSNGGSEMFYHWISVSEYAAVFQVTETQAHMIDGGMAVVLLTLAIGSLFVGRRAKQ